MKKISMVVPCYNEEGNVKLFFEDAINTYKGSKKYKLELIFVDDGSSDNTLTILKEIAKTDKCSVRVISFSRNFGKESVIYAGLKAATGDYTVLIDADMQQPPRMTLKMAELLDSDKNIDCVCYYQDNRIESKLMSSVKSCFYRIMNKMSDVEVKQGASDFRMFRKNVRDSILSLSEKNRFSKGIFAWIGYNVKYLPYKVEPRKSGKSSFGFKASMKYAMEGILAFSQKPLKWAINTGIFSLFVDCM
jgi:glycosyltransferase involved in cell wall biosynthesis